MYCKNCANPVQPTDAACGQCGAPVGAGSAYCQNCAAAVPAGAAACPNCGYPTGVQNADPQAQAYGAAPQAQAYEQKSKLTAGLLGIFLGAFGVHNFYLGYTGKAVAQLLISVLSCGFLAVASEIWGIIEGIMILTGSINVDGKGVPLKD